MKLFINQNISPIHPRARNNAAHRRVYDVFETARSVNTFGVVANAPINVEKPYSEPMIASVGGTTGFTMTRQFNRVSQCEYMKSSNSVYPLYS